MTGTDITGRTHTGDCQCYLIQLDAEWLSSSRGGVTTGTGFNTQSHRLTVFANISQY
jgi:hypothetical protein